MSLDTYKRTHLFCIGNGFSTFPYVALKPIFIALHRIFFVVNFLMAPKCIETKMLIWLLRKKCVSFLDYPN